MSPATAVSRSCRRLGLGAAVAVLAAGVSGPAAAQAQPGVLEGVTPAAAGTQFLAVAVQSDGEIVAAGERGGQIYVQRFTAGGAAEAGATYTGPAGAATGVAIEPGGQIVLGGTMSGEMFAERLTSALTPDPSFGAGGIAGAFGGSSAVGNGVALGPGGTVVVAGSVTVGSGDTRPALARFTASGHLDGSLAGTGGVQLDWGAFSLARGVAVQPDGKIILVGSQSPGFQAVNSIMARLTPGGSYDTSFNGNGIRQYSAPGSANDTFTAATVQNDNKIVVAGSDSSTGNAFFLRLNPNGSTDGGFGSGGVATVPAGFGAGAFSLAIAGQSRIVGAGTFATGATSIDAADFMTSTAGAAAGDFGSGGELNLEDGGYKACGVAVAPDGTIVTVGDTTTPPDTNPCSPRSSVTGFVARVGGFGPPPPPPALSPPSATTGPATAVGPTAATLTGQVNPEGSATSVHFDYGPSPAYGSSTPVVAAGSGATAAPASATLGGLDPNTTYYYRLVATNSAGQTAYGAQASFTTAPSPGVTPPSVSTGAAVRVTLGSARLTGTVNPHGATASFHFELGTSTSYGISTPPASAGSGTSAVNVGTTVTHLRALTLYHYRPVATGPGGTVSGPDRTFRTPAATLGALPRRFSLTSLRRHGLTVTLTCARACSVSATLTISGATAHRLGLGRRTLVLARGKAHSRRAGVLHLHLTAARKLPTLAKGKSIPAQVTASVGVARRHVRLSRGLALTH